MTKDEKKDLYYGSFACALLMIIGFLYNNSNDSQQNSIQINNLMNKESDEVKGRNENYEKLAEKLADRRLKMLLDEYHNSLIRGFYAWNGRKFELYTTTPIEEGHCSTIKETFKTWYVINGKPFDGQAIVCGCAGYKKWSMIDAPCTWNKNADLVAWAEKGYPFK